MLLSLWYNEAMKLTIQVRLDGEHHGLKDMIVQFNSACNALSAIAFQERIFHWLPLQRRAYHWLRAEFGLTGQQATVAIRKVAYAYRNKARRNTLASFNSLGAIPVYYHSYKVDGTVSFYGHRLPFQSRPGVSLSGKAKEAKLVYFQGRFFLHQAIDAPEGKVMTAQGFLAVDLGIVNLAVDSEGAVYSGKAVERNRRIYAHRRRNLQRKGSRSAKRKLQTIRRRQGRYQRDTNHCISKAIVHKAQRHSLGIALEDLGGIRDRITVRRRQRARHHNWGFFQLRAFITYKAALAGVPIIMVNPAYTSQTCPQCGYVHHSNRVSQSLFSCKSCAYSADADFVAALNIRARADDDQPMVAAPASYKFRDVTG